VAAVQSFRVVAAASLIATALIVPAFAQSSEERLGDAIGGAIGNLIVGSIRQAQINRARETWAEIDKDVIACIETQNNVRVEQLIQQTISATDRRLRPYINACNEYVAQQRAAAAAAAAEAERQRLVEEQLAEQRRQERIAAEAAAAAQREERRRQLVGRFGEAQAAAIAAGQVQVGMSSEAVLAARGQPSRIEQITPSEQIWHYGNERVFLANGRVTYLRQ
jgi:hypothetical protein